MRLPLCRSKHHNQSILAIGNISTPLHLRPPYKASRNNFHKAERPHSNKHKVYEDYHLTVTEPFDSRFTPITCIVRKPFEWSSGRPLTHTCPTCPWSKSLAVKEEVTSFNVETECCCGDRMSPVDGPP